MDDVTTQADPSLATTGSATTPDAAGTATDEVTLARKRQSGAEAARQVAEAKAAEFEKELAKYRAAAQTDAEKDLTELAKAQARADAAEQRAAEAETKANAKLLDAKYPAARAEFPDIADEARLAKYEAIFGDEADAPAPMKHNDSRTAAAGTTTPAEKTVKDIEAELLSMKVPWA